MDIITLISENSKLIITSSIFAGLISAAVSYFISVRLKNLDFKNEYYKEILKKRLVVYEHIEIQLSILKRKQKAQRTYLFLNRPSSFLVKERMIRI